MRQYSKIAHWREGPDVYLETRCAEIERGNMRSTRKANDGIGMEWKQADLHVHTPGSAEYLETGMTYLDILRRAEERGLDIIAFTDHNTVRGYAEMLREIEELVLLERLNRLQGQEKTRLAEYRRLRGKIVVLPGVEFTATLGFHILAIFSESTTVREIEHLLLRLNVPPAKLDDGSTEVGATTDVLTAYREMALAGALVIAAHANSTHGVAMQGFDFGGQTKIAYTQDSNLHALEVTDLENGRRRNTASFYNGSKPEYPRRMHCIQGSDAHRVTADLKDKRLLGVADRVTELLLPEVSFAAIKELFLGDDFARTRPYRAKQPFDHVTAARQEGPNIVQSFYETATRTGGRLHAVVCDVVAFANTNGGTIFIGAGPQSKTPLAGVDKPEDVIAALKSEIQRKVTPPVEVTIDALESQGKKVLRVTVPKGTDIPYAVEGTKIYVRQESETSLALRDEIVQLSRRAQEKKPQPAPAPEAAAEKTAGPEEEPLFRIAPPRTGVEIVQSEERKGTIYHALMDLRNGNVVNNVSRKSARRLWRSAIIQHEEAPVAGDKINWLGEIGLWKVYGAGGRKRYNLVQRDRTGRIHYYYGVSEDGFHGEWRQFLKE